MYLKINDDGLSYIEDIHEVQSFQVINQDLFRLSYATYILALADASIQDRQPDPALFAFLEQTLQLMDRGLDYEILTNIFEMQIFIPIWCCLKTSMSVVSVIEWGYLLIFHSAWVVSFAQIIMIVTKDGPTGIQMPSIC